MPAQSHTTLCIQFLDRENDDKNNTLPLGKQICLTIVWGCAEMLPPVVESVGIHICQICNQRLNFLHISIIFKSATSIKHRNFNFSIYLPLVKINRPFGFVDS